METKRKAVKKAANATGIAEIKQIFLERELRPEGRRQAPAKTQR
ncbi:hypothetical protein [Candidatus Pantoea deserta]|nr:hypothetical protein [Pantoea deserta]